MFPCSILCSCAIPPSSWETSVVLYWVLVALIVVYCQAFSLVIIMSHNQRRNRLRWLNMGLTSDAIFLIFACVVE